MTDDIGQTTTREPVRVFVNAPRDANGEPVDSERSSPRPRTISGKRGEWIPAPYPYGSWPPHAGMLIRRVLLWKHMGCAPVEPVVEMLEEGDVGWWVTVANDYSNWVQLANHEEPIEDEGAA